MAEKTTSDQPVTIKKYANRRLYNTATSTYVTLEDLAELVKAGTDFLVHDAKTGEDITRSVLTQIIFEQEGKGENLLPINFLRQLIAFYGDSMQSMVPSYLEFSLNSFSKEQDNFRNQMSQAFGAGPVKAMEEQVQKNMEIFEKAMGMFLPLGANMDAVSGAKSDAAKGADAAAQAQQGGKGGEEMNQLKEQLAAMQRQLDQLSKDGK